TIQYTEPVRLTEEVLLKCAVSAWPESIVFPLASHLKIDFGGFLYKNAEYNNILKNRGYELLSQRIQMQMPKLQEVLIIDYGHDFAKHMDAADSRGWKTDGVLSAMFGKTKSFAITHNNVKLISTFPFSIANTAELTKLNCNAFTDDNTVLRWIMKMSAPTLETLEYHRAATVKAASFFLDAQDKPIVYPRLQKLQFSGYEYPYPKKGYPNLKHIATYTVEFKEFVDNYGSTRFPPNHQLRHWDCLVLENYKILEDLALNDENTYRLSQTLESLQAQENGSNEHNSDIAEEGRKPAQNLAAGVSDSVSGLSAQTAEPEAELSEESSRKRSKPESSVETDSGSLSLDSDQREPTLEVEEKSQQKEEEEDAFDTNAALPQSEVSKDILATEADSLVSREIRDLEDRINYCLQSFDEAPFTIQRIAELLVWPERHYRSAMKFLRAIERVVYVTSTVEDFPPTSTKPKESSDGTSNDKGSNDAGDGPAAIEGVGGASGGVAGQPSSLFSFLASQDTSSAGSGILGSGSGAAGENVATRAVAAKEKQPAISLTAIVTATLGAQSKGEAPGRSNEPERIWTARPPATAEHHTMAPIAAKPLEARRSSEEMPPLDASDTGILHITSASQEESDVLRSKISESVDASIPVCIDGPGGSAGKFSVQPVDPSQIAGQGLTLSGSPLSAGPDLDSSSLVAGSADRNGGETEESAKDKQQ
ncbi:hypothetical protein H4217_007754, partial [Coemansia sp. RSA 1939]